MTNEEIKKLADGYYAGQADWESKEQEYATKIGWRQGFAYGLRQSEKDKIFSLCDHPQTEITSLQGERFCMKCKTVIR